MQLQRTARRKRVATSLVAGAALSLLAVGPAMADHEDWSANPGTTVEEDGTIVLDTTDETETPSGTSFDATEGLDVELTDGDVISFDYVLEEGAVCGGGQPRLYVTVDGTTSNTFDGNDEGDCGELTDGLGTSTEGTVTYTYDGPDGAVEAAGIVFDNISDRGIARITNVTIGDYVLDLQHEEDDEGDDDEGDDDTEADAKDECKDGGWEEQGFRNQGQCIRFVNTGKDSRA